MYSWWKQKRILHYEVRAERGNLLNDIPGSPEGDSLLSGWGGLGGGAVAEEGCGSLQTPTESDRAKLTVQPVWLAAGS